MLEDAARLRNTARVLAAGDAVLRDHDQFAGKNVADELGAEQIESAGFRREDDGVGTARIFHAPHGERAEAVRIARGKDAVARHHDNGKRAFDLRKRIGDGVDQRTGTGVRDELHDDLGVRGGLEICSVAFQAGTHVAQVHQVAVVRDGDEALGGVDANGLSVEQRGITGGGVACVADGHVAGKLGQHIVCENFRNQAHAFDVGKTMAVGGGNPGRFLAAMLQRIEAEVSFARGVGMAVDGDDAAFLVQFFGAARTANRRFAATLTALRISYSLRLVGEAGDPLKQQPAHAGTSSCRLASSADAQSVRSSVSGAEMKVSPSTRISSRLPPVVPMRAERKLYWLAMASISARLL
jgi:hypothetical protein